MRFFSWHVVFAAWLLVSAFALGHSADSAALTGLLAVLIGTFSFAAISYPPVRFLNALVALVLACAALFSTESSAVARMNSAIIAAVVLAFSAVPGRAWGQVAQPRI